MIIGIDGTGSQGWENLDLRRSFVRRILNETRIQPRYYFLGPNNAGSDGDNIIKGACELVRKTSAPITLVGYSRGAAYCMEICARLLRYRWRADPTVDVLVMFDAVARQGDIDLPEKVPSNVRRCFHAFRSAGAGSRYWFQNVGIGVDDRNATKFEKAPFHGSHGALGGTWYDAKNEERVVKPGNAVFWPWIDDRNLTNAPRTPQTNEIQDRAASSGVAQWMWPRLVAAGVLPAGANPQNLAPPFTGSRVPGQYNRVQ
jgi:hypothetical protein